MRTPVQEAPAILEATGQSGLVDAGMQLLEPSEHIQVAVIRGLGTAGLFGLTHRHRPDDIVATLYREIPTLHRLDQVVSIWSARNLPNQYQMLGLHSNGTKSGGIGRHYDSGDLPEYPGQVYDGPLTFSARMDTRHDIDRVFYAQRTEGISLTADGLDFDHEMYLRALSQEEDLHDPTEGMVAIHQAPGDMVLMLNYPTPTIHLVEDPTDDDIDPTDDDFGLTKTILGSWKILNAPADRELDDW